MISGHANIYDLYSPVTSLSAWIRNWVMFKANWSFHVNFPFSFKQETHVEHTCMIFMRYIFISYASWLSVDGLISFLVCGFILMVHTFSVILGTVGYWLPVQVGVLPYTTTPVTSSWWWPPVNFIFSDGTQVWGMAKIWNEV